MADSKNKSAKKKEKAKVVSQRAVKRKSVPPLPQAYPKLLSDIKDRIRHARIKASLAVNAELVYLYWSIGRSIVERRQGEGWGKSLVERLAKDLKEEFPDATGFSARNLWRMRAFYLAWTREIKNLPQAVQNVDGQNLPQAVAEIPWGHNVHLIEAVKDPAERLWYAEKTIENGWSRNVLVHQIESGLYLRKGGAVTNFENLLPPPHSDLAREIVKDPYHFDFLELDGPVSERELEQGLIRHIRDFLLELGRGFAFVGSQYHIEVGGEDFYIDLLFYHLGLRRYVVIDLKIGDFKPEYAGKMNFYLAAVDDLMNHPDDSPAIGLILCKTKKSIIAEYTLRGMQKPIGVSSYKLVRKLPKSLEPALPTVRELEEELKSQGNVD